MDEWLLDASIAELDVGPATAYRRVRGGSIGSTLRGSPPLADIDSNQEGEGARN